MLHRLIGRNSIILVGWEFLGMRTMLVLFIAAMGRLWLKTLRTMLVISVPTML